MKRSSRNASYRTERPSPVRSCDCGSVDIPDGYTSLAMVYTVSQCWRLINDGSDGFERGTIFDELNKPFYGDKCCKNGGYRK